MRTTITIIGISLVHVCGTLWAQESSRPASGGLAERSQQLDPTADGNLSGDQVEAIFKRLDRDGNGKLSADEVAPYPGLKRLLEQGDADRDGALSLEELKAVYRGGQNGGAKATVAGNTSASAAGFKPMKQDFTVED